MGQINTTNLPQYVSDPRVAAAKSKTSNEAAAPSSLPETNTPQDDMQLTKLGGVLNSLKKGATAMRSQVAQVMTSVRSGTYQIDPMQVSRSIVGESLASR
jgi:anti-sigma28 factor (negative regulator of flagellin synthesis)